MDKETEIINSWKINAKPWSKAIKVKEIESRNLVTNKAILNTIQNIMPGYVLDLGCGEGWLSKELIDSGVKVIGLDAIPELIEQARKLSNAKFDICTYEGLDNYKFNNEIDCIVCNFSLVGKESTEAAIINSGSILKSGGKLVIQTLHPLVSCGSQSYVEGWREGSWVGFNKEFTNPAPWYFRTIEAWTKLFWKAEFKLESILEPLHPHTEKPAAIIFICSKF